jgi:hypothetical protein
MLHPKKIYVTFMVLSAISAMSGCKLLGTSDSSTSAATDTSGGGGSGGTFTGSDLNGSWSSACLPMAGTVTGETYYQNNISITGGNTWGMIQYTYSAASCTGGVYMNYYSVGGTFTVGGVVSGKMQSIQFTASGGSSVQPLNASATTWWNTNATTAGFSTGSSHSLWNDALNGITTFYPTSSVNQTIYNVATFSTGALTLGAGSESVPGVYLIGSTPTSVTVAYH